MNKKIFYFVIIIIAFISNLAFSQDQDGAIEIKDIYERKKVLDEWRIPGRYSPVNMFDNDNNTAFAEGNTDHYTTIYIEFKEYIECDAIQILGGYNKNTEIFQNNNRPKKINIYLAKTKDEYYKKNVELYEKEIMLKDTNVYQSVSFNNIYQFKFMIIQILSVYPGTQYNDTCITELKFFNKGQEIPIKNVTKLKKDYIKWVGERLQNFFQMEKYEVYSTGSIGKATVTKSGNISYYIYPADAASNPPLPTGFYIKDSKLYMTIKGNTGLVEYSLILREPTRMLIETIGSYKYIGGASPVFEVIKEDKK